MKRPRCATSRRPVSKSNVPAAACAVNSRGTTRRCLDGKLADGLAAARRGRPDHALPAGALRHGLACLAVLRETIGEFPIEAAAGCPSANSRRTRLRARSILKQASGCRAARPFHAGSLRANAGGMAAMIGGDESAVRALAAETDVDVANLNSPGQIVLSGEAAKIALAFRSPRSTGFASPRP